MILNPEAPPLPEMCDFTLLGTTAGTTVGAPDIDLHAPTNVAVATDEKISIVVINVASEQDIFEYSMYERSIIKELRISELILHQLTNKILVTIIFKQNENNVQYINRIAHVQ